MKYILKVAVIASTFALIGSAAMAQSSPPATGAGPSRDMPAAANPEGRSAYPDRAGSTADQSKSSTDSRTNNINGASPQNPEGSTEKSGN